MSSDLICLICCEHCLYRGQACPFLESALSEWRGESFLKRGAVSGGKKEESVHFRDERAEVGLW